MAEVQIDDSCIPDLQGQTALVTGGSTGIGHALVDVLIQHGAKVHVVDIKIAGAYLHPSQVVYHQCDISSWAELSKVFISIPSIDMVFANAGVAEEESFLADLHPDAEGGFLEPTSPVVGVNLLATLNTIKLAIHAMKKQENGGRIVLTSSATAYMPELSIPLYSALKLALVGLVRSLRNNLLDYNITINAVAPAATSTPLIAGGFEQCLKANNLPTSTARFVALALAFSATAHQSRPVDVYGKNDKMQYGASQRWNGRVIVTLEDTYTEVEEPLLNLRTRWFGARNEELTKMQQAATMQV